jgi:hypothetical protein
MDMRARMAPLWLLIVVVSQISVSFASSISTAGIVSSGTIVYSQAPTRVWDLMCADYGTPINSSIATYLGSHFNLVDVGFELNNGFQLLKNANPNIIIIGYVDFIWYGTGGDESWYLHDNNGTRVQRSDGWYLMNPASSGWRNYTATRCARFLSTYPLCDGIFADNVQTAVFFKWSQLNVPVANIPDPVTGTGSVTTNWNTYMAGLVQRVKAAMASKILIINCPDAEGNLIDYCDGQMIEGFMHPAWFASTHYPDPLSGMYSIPLLEQLAATGKIVLAYSGATIPANPTASDKAAMDQCMLYCLCGFLLGYSGKAMFGCMSFTTGSVDLYSYGQGYWPAMDSPIGTPVGARYNVQGSLWARDFTNGKVYLNVDDSTSYTVTVGSTNYTVSPRSGLIVTT